jgi:hypothetical protein
MNDFVVYKHYTADEHVLFYIGEGRPSRANDIKYRNRYWNHVVAKHGFYSKIVYNGLTKDNSEELETRLIKIYKRSKSVKCKLTNLCDGPMFKHHWLANAPKEIHPMYGKKHPNPKLAQWNREHSGENSPTYGLKRPDLAGRNRLSDFTRSTKKVQCIETGQIFDSCKRIFEHFGIKASGHLSKAIADSTKTWRKCHWQAV